MIALGEGLSELPRYRRFLQSLAEDLKRGGSVICLTGRSARAQDVAIALRAHVELRDFLPLHADAGVAKPLASISNALGCDIGALMRGAEHDVEIDRDLLIFVNGLDDVHREQQRSWIEFAERWADRQQALGAGGGPGLPPLFLALRGEGLESLPTGRVNLIVRGAIDVCGSLELQLLVRSFSENDLDRDATLWREHVLPAIAGADIELAEACWSPCVERVSDMIAACRAVAIERGWTRERASAANHLLEQLRVKRTLRPEQMSIAAREAWGEGLLAYTLESGFEVSSAAHALNEDNARCERRLWRGQAQLVLPIVDRVRIELCVALGRRLEEGWQLRPPPGAPEELAEVRDDPLACQLGHLHSVIEKARVLASNQRERWLRVIREVRRARNTLAHYRPIEFADFVALNQVVSAAELQ